MRWSVAAPYGTAFLLIAAGLVLLEAKHTSAAPKDAITRSYYERLLTLQTKAPSRLLRQRSAIGYGDDSAAIGNGGKTAAKEQKMSGKAVAGQTFTEEDLKKEQMNTAKKAPARMPAPKAPTRRPVHTKKPDAGVVRAPPSTAPSSFTAPPATAGPTTLPPSTEPSPPATSSPPLRLTKQRNGTYTLEQMGKKKASNKPVDYFGRPITGAKMLPTLSKMKATGKMTPPPSAKSVESALPNAIVGFPKQQKAVTHGYDAAVESLPATQPSGYDMGVDGAESRHEEQTTVATTTLETVTVTKTLFSTDEDPYGAASADVQAAEQKESGYGQTEDAPVHAAEPKQSKAGYAESEDAAVTSSKQGVKSGAYDQSEDAAVHADKPKQSSGSYGEDAAVQSDKPKQSAGAYDASEDAALHAAEQKQSAYGEDAAVHADTLKQSSYGESEDAALLAATQDEDEVVSSTEQDTTTMSSNDDQDTPASMDVRSSTDAADDAAEATGATPSTTASTTLAARAGYDVPEDAAVHADQQSSYADAGVEGGSESHEDASTTVASASYDGAVESASNETEVESTTSAVETTTTIFAARNPYGGEEEDREVDVSIDTTTRADEGNSTGYGGEEDEALQRMLADEDDLLSSSTPSDVNSTDVGVESTTSHSEMTTEYLMNFGSKGDSVAGEINEEEEEETTTPAGEDKDSAAEDLDDNDIEDITAMPTTASSTGSAVDDEELIHQVERAVERVLGEELTEQSTTVKGPTVTSAPMKVFDKAPTLIHNRLKINPQEAHRGANSTSAQKGFKETCPPPHRCPKNCFVFINDNGCQDCQCLWQSLPCEAAEDCPEGSQYCDEGKCQCRPGYKQNMRKSGSCEIDESFQGVRSIAAHVKSDAAIMKGKEMHQVVKEETFTGGYRRKRAALVKTFRDERLQWPGPCDNDDQCPENLWCLQGDCWALPDKPIKMDHLTKKAPSSKAPAAVPSSFPIESSERSKLEADLWKELQEEEEREKGGITINRDTDEKSKFRVITPPPDKLNYISLNLFIDFDDGQLVVPLAELTTPSAKARSRFFRGKSDGFITARTSSTTAAPAPPTLRQPQPARSELQQQVAAPPGFTPSLGDVIEMEKSQVKGRGEPDFDSFPIRASGVKLSHPDLLASRDIAPLHPALFLPPPSKTEETTTTSVEKKRKGVKQIELPQEKEVHFNAREIARRRKELKRRLEKTRQRRVRVENDTLDPVEFPLSSKQHKLIDNEAREGEEEEGHDRPVITLPNETPRVPSVLGEDYTDDSFHRQFEEQKKRLESSSQSDTAASYFTHSLTDQMKERVWEIKKRTLGPFRRRTTAVSNSVERSAERDEPSGESRRIPTQSSVVEEPEKEEFHPRKASVPPLSTLATLDTELPITSSPIGRILSLEERRIARAQAQLDREISEALKTKSVDDLLREQIRRINKESDGQRSSTLIFSTTPSPRVSTFQSSPLFERTTLPSTDSTSTLTTPFVTPGKPFEESDGVWSSMDERTTVKTLLRDLRRSPSSRLIYEYTSENIRHKPVRVEMDRAADSMRDECSEDSQCGSRLRCCKKKWCDRSRNCGTGNFCLPSCEMTKMTHLGRGSSRESLIDIIYD